MSLSASASAETKKRVAVIGAGISGLTALKECLAEGFVPDVFEARSEIGGLWAYQPLPDDGPTGEIHSTMYDGVILNSCRDSTSFSDFPLDPARYGDYFGHRRMLQYIHEYADHFDLKRHIQLRTKTVSCVQTEDGGWALKIQREGGEVEERVYDVLFAATGARTIPSVPDFKGRELFEGEFMHSQLYRKPGRFEGKRVALIGFGSAAVDLSSELAPACKEVHLITRRGGWVLPRFVLGKPAEAWDDRATQVWLPPSVSQWAQTQLLNFLQGKHPEELRAEHSIMEQNPTVRSEFLERVRTGSIQAHRADVESFTEHGLRLSNGTNLDVDVVIACTGFNHSLPYLPADVLHAPDTPANSVDLWKLLVPFRYRNLFVMGFIEGAGPSPPSVEAQARFSAAVLAGRVKLPAPQQLEEETRQWQANHAKKFVRSQRHSITEHYVPYIDSLLAPLGAAPTLGNMLGQVFTSGSPWRGLKTFNAVYFGVTSSAQWRLCGYGKDDLARETVLRIADGKDKLSEKEVQYLNSK